MRTVSVTVWTSEREEVNIYIPCGTICNTQRINVCFILVMMENNYRAEKRFRFHHYFFYVGGIPLFYSAVSNLYRVYSFIFHVCFCMIIIAMFLDIYHHLEDWDHILDTSMFFIVFVCEFCTIAYFR
jgi:hypothetical protein